MQILIGNFENILLIIMAKTEAQKAARRERRAIARREAEATRAEIERRFSERQAPGPYDEVICYRCHKKGHYAIKCRVRRKKRNVDDRFARPEIVCFKCREKGHFLSHCPKVKRKKCVLNLPVDRLTICYHCRQTGHIARNCTERQRGEQAIARPARAKSVMVIDKDGNISYYCNNCKEWGHVDFECVNPPLTQYEVVSSEDESLAKMPTIGQEVVSP